MTPLDPATLRQIADVLDGLAAKEQRNETHARERLDDAQRDWLASKDIGAIRLRNVLHARAWSGAYLSVARMLRNRATRAEKKR